MNMVALARVGAKRLETADAEPVGR
jgi:hypothetical protein